MKHMSIFWLTLTRGGRQPFHRSDFVFFTKNCSLHTLFFKSSPKESVQTWREQYSKSNLLISQEETAQKHQTLGGEEGDVTTVTKDVLFSGNCNRAGG